MFPESYQDVRAFALGIAADLAEPTDHVEDRREDDLEFGDPD